MADTDNAPEQQPPPKRNLREAFRNAPTNAERRQLMAEWRAKSFSSDVDAILAEYEAKDPARFNMGKMLHSLRSLERLMDNVENIVWRGRAIRESDDSDAPAEQQKEPITLKERKEMMMVHLRYQKQHLDTCKAIATYEEKVYHSKIKAARGNKTAAPGQQVGIALPTQLPKPNNGDVCEPRKQF